MRLKRHSPAFTLIELLVVISIIALLIALLLPALGSAKAAARSVTCLSQMQQMGVGFSMYETDHGELVLARFEPPSTGDDAEWCATLLAEDYLQGEWAPDFNNTSIMPGSSPFVCPDGLPEETADAMGRYNVESLKFHKSLYTINGNQKFVQNHYAINGGKDSDWTGRHRPFQRAGSWKNNISTDAIETPTEMVALTDGYFHLYSDSRVSARHYGRSKTNVLFMAGNAASYKTDDVPDVGTASTDAEIMHFKQVGMR